MASLVFLVCVLGFRFHRKYSRRWFTKPSLKPIYYLALRSFFVYWESSNLNILFYPQMRGLMSSEQTLKWSFWLSRALLCSSVVFSNFPTTVSSSDNTTTTSPPYSTHSPNISVFSCKWEDLKFPITYGTGIACALSVIVGGFELFVGK